VAPAADWSVLRALGLADPRADLPRGFTTVKARQSPGGDGIEATFEDSQGGSIQLSAVPLTGPPGGGYLTDAGARWSNGIGYMNLSGRRAELPIGKAVLRSLAVALDPSFAHACIVESATADAATIQSLGLRVPAAPAGFSNGASALDLTRATGDCANGQTRPKTFDFSWSFTGKNGEILRAGVYSFGTSLPGQAAASQSDPGSLSWGDKSGARYWVAADPSTAAQPVQDELYQLARSLDPTFSP
jgi:hypothetical protein